MPKKAKKPLVFTARVKRLIATCTILFAILCGISNVFEIYVCQIALVVPSCGGFLGLSKGEGLVIPWEKIECIGEDTILVKLTPGELSACLTRPSRTSKKSTTTK